ncbi:MAG: LD-carboxypeptidase, partial [Chitinophagales bacterium]|nr:LD-carboxypeptidase [Chitinophagales bacterium]
MKTLIKPEILRKGDKVATISLSWGGAAEYTHRYQAGKRQLEENFGVTVIETRNALKSADWLYKNPQARAEDLMEAFADNSIKAIFSNIGGEDSIRILPFIDLTVITKNPKIFLGNSDTTITHLACYKAGLGSFYGIPVLVGFAENGGMFPYQREDIKRTLFTAEVIGQILPNTSGWASEKVDWADITSATQKRKLTETTGWNFLQGSGIVEVKLIGGCVEVLEFLKATEYWFEPNEWNNKILFLETSEETLPPINFKRIIWNYAAQGVFHKIKGLILGRPYDNKFTDEYNKILLQVIKDELQLTELPLITEMDFGHT